MRTLVTEIKLYSFNELSEEAKQTAIENYREGNLYYEWWESIYEDAKTIAALIGIDIDDINFTGFWSQGDGACFTGSYRYVKGGLKALQDHIGNNDNELTRIAEELQAAQRKNFYRVNVSIGRGRLSNHYSHSNTMAFDMENTENRYQAIECEDDIEQALKDFADWIYNQLEKEYDYLNSDEGITDTINCNDYEFTVSGKLY